MRQALAKILGGVLCATGTVAWGQIPAFSGAQGPGAIATGGRGGDVYHVTTLDPDKSGVLEGSLQYGINTAPSSGRIIVFDVGGTIYLDGQTANDTLRYGKANITVAGQTAPGPGITIAGTGTKWTGTNIILRNITVRPRLNSNGTTYDAFSLQLKSSIVDHVSTTWFTDEGISQTDSGHTTTVQYALINEGLNYVGHSYGSIISTEVDGAENSYNHNLYAHNNSRMPRLGSEMALTATGAVTDFTNNVIYNWPSRAGYSGTDQPSSTNFLGNYYIRGNNNGTTVFKGGDSAANPGATKIYHSGNLYDGNKNGVADGTPVTNSQFTDLRLIVSQAFDIQGMGAVDTATSALQRVLDYGGANWQNRNPIEERIVQSVRNGTGNVINDISSGVQAIEWANVMSQTTATTREANWDTDQDGMPDYWELKHGLDPAVAGHNADFDADGYPDLEEYINELGEWPAPGPIVFANGMDNGRFANIQNWRVSGQQVNVAGQGMVTSGSNWQPSKYDEARINSGTVVVDAVGQHAGNLKIATGSTDSAVLNITAGWLDVANTVTVGDAAASQGTLNLSGGILRTNRLEKGAASEFHFTGGSLAANEVAFSFTNEGGVITPASSPGTTHVLGDLTQTAGTVLLAIAGSTEGQFDRLVVDGALAAGGELNVTLEGYSPVEGDSFDLLDFGSLSGGFVVSLPGLESGLAWDISAFDANGILSVVSAPVGDADFNNDGVVDGRDFLVWQRGESPNTGSAEDLALWQEQYGNPGPLSASVAVPEPVTGWLLAMLLGFVTAGRQLWSCG
jgi:hypothetical protein